MFNKSLNFTILILLFIQICNIYNESTYTVIFEDDFESGSLNTKWTGKNGEVPVTIIAQDPYNLKNHALTFIRIIGAGDVFSDIVTSESGKFLICFKYLGYLKSGSIPSNTGGYIGYSYGTPGGHYWLAATLNDR